ncbi:uncharacterized protein METZ01_LOCUS457148, partial [marine metagenome]
NSGTSESSPFQTITYALGVAAQIEDDPTTIHLGPGVYSPTTDCAAGEIFDCDGHCAPEAWLGNETCDFNYMYYNGYTIDFNCEEFEYDFGDCDSWEYCSEINVSWINSDICLWPWDLNGHLFLFEDNCVKTDVYIWYQGNYYEENDRQLTTHVTAGTDPYEQLSIQFGSNGVLSEVYTLTGSEPCTVGPGLCSNIYDCNNSCISDLVLSGLNDLNCNDAQPGWGTNYNCSQWNYDFGDCSGGSDDECSSTEV